MRNLHLVKIYLLLKVSDTRLTEDFQGERYITGCLYFQPSNNTQGDRSTFLAVSIFFIQHI